MPYFLFVGIAFIVWTIFWVTVLFLLRKAARRLCFFADRWSRERGHNSYLARFERWIMDEETH